jgi:hypothetical protein
MNLIFSLYDGASAISPVGVTNCLLFTFRCLIVVLADGQHPVDLTD